MEPTLMVQECYANYLLQWEMIKWAVESGCDIYDFRGVSGSWTKQHHYISLRRDLTENLEFIGDLDCI